MKFILTINSFDSIRNIQFETGCQCAEECCGVVGALETLSGLLEALTVVHLQVNHRAVWRNTYSCNPYFTQTVISKSDIPAYPLTCKLSSSLLVLVLPPAASYNLPVTLFRTFPGTSDQVSTERFTLYFFSSCSSP